MFYELHLMIRTENRAHRSRKLLLEIELVFAREGDTCSFRQRQVVFVGHTNQLNGVQADPRKIETIKNMQPPRNVSEIKSHLGMTQYVYHFIPNYASIATPLRALIHQNVSWK